MESISPNNILVQCRICHNEDEESHMETPCSCSGTLKQFTPGYTVPPPLIHYGGSPINFGWNYWETSRRVHNNNNQFVSMFGADHHDLEPDIEYSTPSTRSMIWCRIIATIFLGLIVLRHTLQVILILSETEEYSLTVFMLLLLGILGILISIHTMIKANYYGPRTSTPDSSFPYFIT
ncbi:hypothetical protein HN51_068180 [Arachis hypogaea]